MSILRSPLVEDAISNLKLGTDFFTVEVWTLNGLVTFYLLFFIRVSSREIHIAGITSHPKNESVLIF